MTRIRGALFGTAYGDAFAAPTEFLNIAQIRENWPPCGPMDLEGDPARVTDDTQMALAVGAALSRCPRETLGEDLAGFEHRLRRRFVEWANSPENDRAPGRTCMAACAELERGLPWYRATQDDSKGCGANMRVQPVGLLRLADWSAADPRRGRLAQFQAALTHGHPTALAASDLTAFALAWLARAEGPLDGLLPALREYAVGRRCKSPESWLEPLAREGWRRPASKAMTLGWDECIGVLEALDRALRAPDRQTDPCEQTGAAWIAEEAFATGLLCFLLFPDEPVAALRRAAGTSGDSDSIACLTGAFVGAHRGFEAWPSAWESQIEYRMELNTLSLELAK
ncbi:MAG: ADP-ribosylglycohydrolase family protein [Planctomycetes bacterium]|nr:ADP-ribosylglycohydrolase family protein [Planctomycetota bacterium]